MEDKTVPLKVDEESDVNGTIAEEHYGDSRDTSRCEKYTEKTWLEYFWCYRICERTVVVKV